MKSLNNPSSLKIVAFGIIFQQIISFLSGVVIARVTGAAAYGVFSLARMMQQSVCLFARLGLDVGLQRFIGEAADDNVERQARIHLVDMFRKATLVASVLPIVILACGMGDWIERTLFPYHDFSLLLLVTFLAIPFLSDLAVLGGVYRGVLNPAPSIISEYIILPAVRLGTIVLMFVFGYRLWAVVIGTSFAAAVAAFCLALKFYYDTRKARKKCTVPDPDKARKDVRETIGYSIVIACAMSVTLFTRSVDTYFLGYFRSAKEVGQYSATQMTLILVGLFGTIIGQSLGAQIARSFANRNIKEIEALLESNVRLIALVSCPLFAVFCFWGSDLMLIFGPSYTVPAGVVQLLAGSALLVTLMACAGFALSMTGEHRLELKILICGLVSSAVLCALLVPRWGQAGAASAVFISLLLVNLMRLYAVHKYVGIFHLRVSHVRIFLWAILIAVPFAMTAGGSGIWRIGRAIGGASAYLGTYSIFLWNVLDHQQKHRLLSFFRPTSL